MPVFVTEDKNYPVRYVCDSCPFTFTRISDRPLKSELPCSQCENGVMHMEEI
jgi:transposase-like protein